MPEKVSSTTNSILSEEEIQQFENIYPEVVNDVVRMTEDIMEGNGSELVVDWIVQLLDYTVPHGKKLRGIMVPFTYKNVMQIQGTPVTEEQMKLSYQLGWILEILQAASLVADDIMDGSETRRGQPCWFRRPGVGTSAVNDCFILEMIQHNLLKQYFGDKPYYENLNDAIHDLVFYTICGQGLDCHTEKSENFVETYTMERYNTIVQYKTSYYTFYLPVLVALIMARKDSDKKGLLAVEQVALDIGHYFQVQDDFLDCFGDEKVTGKVGTDIQDNKCSWLCVKALEKCSAEELQIMQDNYGKMDADCVRKVKRLYHDLGLEREFDEFENEMVMKLMEKLEKLPEHIPADLFVNLLSKLHKRIK